MREWAGRLFGGAVGLLNMKPLLLLSILLSGCATTGVNPSWYVFSDKEVTDLSINPTCTKVVNGYVCEELDP